ncbi:tetratricopeptide repeat protein [Spirochaeta cellobiosiphila]|uniref:tetratricopeptide repeat protein n=1 Tax=Spirochaeta cellobiosiphila TaxID=504483 RepID=UPI0004100837|nr:tetratricopeptide repeat protein [Spirochaeta cellobiosiphila]
MKRQLIVISLFLLSLTLFGEGSDALFFKGQQAFGQKNFDEALLYFGQLVKTYPNDTRADDAYYYQGVSFFYKNDYKRAANQFSSMEKRYPSSRFISRINYWIGASYLGLQDYRKSEIAFKKQVDYTNEVALLSQSHFYLALSYEKNNKLKKALSEYKVSFDGDLKDNFKAQALYRMGTTNMLLENWIDARNNFNQLLISYPRSEWSIDSVYLIGQVAFELKDYESAESRWDTFLKTSPSSEYRKDALYRLAMLKLQLGKADEGYSLLDLLVNDYNTGDLYKNSLILLADHATDNNLFTDGQNYYKKLISLATDPEEKQNYYYGLGKTYFNTDDPLKALPWLESSIDGPDSEIKRLATYNWGRIQMEHGDWQLGAERLKSYLLNYSQYEGSERIAQVVVTRLERNEAYDDELDWLNMLDRFYPDSEYHSIYVLKRIDIALQQGHTDIDTSSLSVLTESEDLDVATKALYRMGYIYSLRKEYMRSEGYYYRITELLSTGELYEKALLARGICFMNINDNDKALGVFNRLLREKPDSTFAPKTHYYKGNIYKRTADYTQAIKEYLAANTTLNGSMREKLLLNLGEAQLLADEAEDALETYKQYYTLMTDPLKQKDAGKRVIQAAISAKKYEEAINFIGNKQGSDLLPYLVDAYLGLGNYTKASELYYEGLSKGKDLGAIIDGYISLLEYQYGSNNNEEIRSITDNSLQKASPDLEKLIYLNGAKTAFTWNNYSEARRLFMRFLENYPNDPNALGASDALAITIRTTNSNEFNQSVLDYLKTNNTSIQFPTDPLYVALGRLYPDDEFIIDQLKNILKNPESSKYLVEAQFLMGEYYYAQNNLTNAYLLFDVVINSGISPDVLESYSKEIQIVYTQQGFEQAAEIVQKAFVNLNSEQEKGRILYEGYLLAYQASMTSSSSSQFFYNQLEQNFSDTIWYEKAKSLE